MALKPLPRLIVIVSAVAGSWYGVNRYVQYSHTQNLTASAVPAHVDVPVAGSLPSNAAVPRRDQLAPSPQPLHKQ